MLFAILVLVYGLRSNELLNIVPLVRRIMVDTMSDILVILNNSNRIVDYNRSLRQLLTDCGGDCRGLCRKVQRVPSRCISRMAPTACSGSLFAPCAAGAVVPPRSISS